MYKKLLVPIAFDEDTTKAKIALKAARVLAGTGADIILLHVMEQVPVYAMSYVPQEYVAESRAAIQTGLDGYAAELDNARAVVVDGHASRTILDYAEENDCDCIVIASHRPGMQDLLLGSTAAKVVRHAKCAVHVMR